jgi:hypothetical protein
VKAINGSIRFVWAGDERLFRLRLGELRELQTLCDAGPEEIKDRILLGKWRVDDLREVLRLGLIGGGMDPIKAIALMKQHFDEVEPLKNKTPAFLVITAGLCGDPQDEVGKKAGAEESQKSGSASPPSTEPESSSGLPPNKSTSSRSGSSRHVSTGGTKRKVETTTPIQ